MPTPGQNESQDAFVQRCIPILIEEGTAKDGAQAAAICHSMWQNKSADLPENGVIKMIAKVLKAFGLQKAVSDDDVRRAFNTAFPAQQPAAPQPVNAPYVRAVLMEEDAVVYEEGSKLYKCPFTIDEKGNITFDTTKKTEVRVAYQAVEKDTLTSSDVPAKTPGQGCLKGDPQCPSTYRKADDAPVHKCDASLGLECATHTDVEKGNPMRPSGDDCEWRTVQGAKVCIGGDGTVEQGPAHMRGKKPGDAPRRNVSDKAMRAYNTLQREERNLKQLRDQGGSKAEINQAQRKVREATAEYRRLATEDLDRLHKHCGAPDYLALQSVAKDAVLDGAMVAFLLPQTLAKALAIKDGEPASRLHLTLAYLGKGEELPANLSETLYPVLENFAKSHAPITVKLTGVKRFSGTQDDGQDVVYASVEAPELAEFRMELVKALEDAGLPVHKEHDFTPHITLAYTAKLAPVTASVPEQEITFEALHGVIERKAKAFNLKDALPAMKYAVFKEDMERRYTLGVAYPHDELDAHKEYMSAEQLEDAAWRAMQKGLRAGRDHAKGTDGAGQVVESYIWRGPDWKVGDQTVKAGDWMLGVIWHPDVWKDIRAGKLKGFSMQGWAGRKVANESPSR